VARLKGDTPPTTRIPSASAHSHEYNASGVVVHLPHLRLRRPRRTTKTVQRASTRKKGGQENRQRQGGHRGPRSSGGKAMPSLTCPGQRHQKPTTGRPPARWANIAHPRRRKTRAPLRAPRATRPPTGAASLRRRRRRGPKILQRRRRAPAPRRRKHPVVAAAAAARQGRRAPTPRALRPPTSPYARGEARLAEPASPSSRRESDDGKTFPSRRHRARRR